MALLGAGMLAVAFYASTFVFSYRDLFGTVDRAALARQPYGVISDQPLRARQVRGE